MVETPSSSSSSSSSCASFSSFDDVSVKSNGAVKFLCNCGKGNKGTELRGGLFFFFFFLVDLTELQTKLGELCGWGSVSLRCQLPTEDLDALVSITSDEDLANLIEEYDLANRERVNPLKIRAFLHEPMASSKSSKSPSPPPQASSSSSLSPVRSHRCHHHHHHHHHHHDHQIPSVPSRLYGRSLRDARFDDKYDHHQRQQHAQPRNYRYLVHN
ncbi:transcription factor MafB-like [Asparagus officinalis]|uniref:transcription factor MafB-like n=1 Tax=Asparagus officinalis TaxID=4686 RepID=UPI00098DE202|nr:transcription factor MafB-like [Asparagus officinalis]